MLLDDGSKGEDGNQMCPMHGGAGKLIMALLGSRRGPCHPGYVEHRAIHCSAFVSPGAPSEPMMLDQRRQRAGPSTFYFYSPPEELSVSAAFIVRERKIHKQQQQEGVSVSPILFFPGA